MRYNGAMSDLSPVRRALALALIAIVLLPVLLAGCGDGAVNNPYPAADAEKNIFYDHFSERPKHLDPAQSYSANEYEFIGQIYEPPLEYHFLKRPYTLQPLTAARMPEVRLLDARGHELPAGTPMAKARRIAYRVAIRPGIRYQPHPAFARGADGRYLYHALPPAEIARIHTLADLPTTPPADTRELTAADYVYAIKRLAHPRVHSPITSLMMGYLLGLDDLAARLKLAASQGQEKGQEKGQGKGTTFIDLRQFDLEGARVIDAHTFEVVLKEPYPQFIYWLSMMFFAPMPWEADLFYSQPGLAERNISLDWFPVGTGPFYLAENNPNRRMVLRRNPYFHGERYPSEGAPGDKEAGLLEDAGRPIPFIDEAVFSLEKEYIPAWNKFLQGYYDRAGLASDSFDLAVALNAQGEAALTESMREKDIRLASAVMTSSHYWGFNLRDPVVGGPGEPARLLRRAIAIAVDVEEFVAIFANGQGIPAMGPLPPGIFGYREGEAGVNPHTHRWVGGRAVRRPIAEAQALLAQAGYPEGRDPNTGQPLVLYFDTATTGAGSKSLLDWLRKQFAKLGIELVVRATDYNRFQEKMLKGTAQIYEWGWNADYPDPENFLFLLYGPNGKVEKGGENASNYADPRFDAEFERMKAMESGPERQKVLDAMVDQLRADGPWLWGYHPVAYALHHGWFHNTKPNLLANNTLKFKRIEPARRAALREAWNQPVLWPLWGGAVLLVGLVVPAAVSYRRRQQRGARC
jgi:ABC-type transport system substrate-binding protein